MNHQQRQRKINLAVDAVFGGGITDEEYEQIKEAANYRPCPECGDSFRWTLQFYPGPMAKLGDKYCSERCVRSAERENAPLIKTQPKGQKIDNWDV